MLNYGYHAHRIDNGHLLRHSDHRGGRYLRHGNVGCICTDVHASDTDSDVHFDATEFAGSQLALHSDCDVLSRSACRVRCERWLFD